MTSGHHYEVTLLWTGDRGSGTSDYRAYGRDHIVRAEGKPELLGSSDPSFRGDPARYNPEELLVAALSACHMLSYLHLCAVNGICVREYRDTASGALELDADGGGRMTGVTLRPHVRISRGDRERAESLHHEAHERCFIASSVSFPVTALPTVELTPESLPSTRGAPPS